MKKSFFLLTTVAGIGYLILSGSAGGPALSTAGNRTGAQGSTANCSGVACHGSGTATAVSIIVDSGITAIPVTQYKPGALYTIKIHGTNSSGLPKFGFQFAAVSGPGISQVQAGSFPAPPTPLHTALTGSSLTVVEHGLPIFATSPGVFDVSFQWTAPATDVGDITLYCTLNAVNGNNSADAGDIAGNISVVLKQIAQSSVATLANNAEIKAYPDPVINNLYLHLDNAQPGNYTLQVYDVNGKRIENENIELKTNSKVTYINTTNWPHGIYIVVIEKEGCRQVIPVVKK